MFVRFFDEAAEAGLTASEADESAVLTVDEPESSTATETSTSLTPEPASQPPADPYASVFDLAESEGLSHFRTKYPSGEAAIRAALNAAKAVSKRDSYAEIGRKLAPHADQIEEFIRQRTNAPQDRPAEPADAWDLPQFPQAALRYLTRDENGRLTADPSAPVSVRTAVDQWNERRENLVHGITTDPRKTLVDPIKEEVRRELRAEFEEMIAQREQAVRVQTEIGAIEQSISPWLYQYGPSGQVLMTFDPNTGGEVPMLSPHGAAYVQAARRLRAGGMQNLRDIHETALQLVGGPPQAAAPAAPAPKPAGTNGATRTPQRSRKPYENSEKVSLLEIARANGDPVDGAE